MTKTYSILRSITLLITVSAGLAPHVLAAGENHCIAKYREVAERLSGVIGTDVVYKDRGNRCEGFTGAYTGADDAVARRYFDLISLTRSRPAKAPGRDSVIVIHLASTSSITDAPARVEVQAIPRSGDYRLDARLDENGVQWPMGDVVVPAIADGVISLSNLGAFGVRQVEGQRLYEPVDLLLDGASPDSVPLSYNVAIRPRAPVWNRNWALCELGETCCDRLFVDQDVAGHEGHDDGYQFNISAPGPGRYCLAVSADFCPGGGQSATSAVCTGQGSTQFGVFYLSLQN